MNDRVAASTQNQAFNSLLFLYKQVLKIDLPEIEGVERARRSTSLVTCEKVWSEVSKGMNMQTIDFASKVEFSTLRVISSNSWIVF